MAKYEFFLASSLEKVFPTRRPRAVKTGETLSLWRGSRGAVQLVYRASKRASRRSFTVEVTGTPWDAQLRHVALVPSELPANENADRHYITKKPGLFPDLLSPTEDREILALPGQYRSLWISWDVPEDARPGDYPVTVTVRSEKEVHALPFTLRIAAARLPEQRLIHTQWFHTDCLAQYYHVDVFSEEYWHITENFIRSAGNHGINMLLTPVFTPPLDTLVGGQRLTVQLVDVTVQKGEYSFGFEKLERWAGLCKKHGIRYIEVPHLFTQWGAEATPKIEATVDGEKRQIFGWDVPGASPEYRRFLEAFLPALRQKLEELGYDRDHVYFHISDEPSAAQLNSYKAAKAQTAGLLDDCPMIDALSSLKFYNRGLVNTPVCASDHIQPFLKAGVPELWVYYCCAQGKRVPNRFFAMESARNRIMGVLMYLYHIKGFLHWGFNFYNSQFSRHPIDPYRVTDARLAFPSGDPFLVYPGENGEALSSIRAEVQDEALLDLRALQQLEALKGQEAVEALVGKPRMTFRRYPRNADYLLKLRERLAEELDKAEGIKALSL